MVAMGIGEWDYPTAESMLVQRRRKENKKQSWGRDGT